MSLFAKFTRLLLSENSQFVQTTILSTDASQVATAMRLQNTGLATQSTGNSASTTTTTIESTTKEFLLDTDKMALLVATLVVLLGALAGGLDTDALDTAAPFASEMSRTAQTTMDSLALLSNGTLVEFLEPADATHSSRMMAGHRATSRRTMYAGKSQRSFDAASSVGASLELVLRVGEALASRCSTEKVRSRDRRWVQVSEKRLEEKGKEG